MSAIATDEGGHRMIAKGFGANNVALISLEKRGDFGYNSRHRCQKTDPQAKRAPQSSSMRGLLEAMSLACAGFVSAFTPRPGPRLFRARLLDLRFTDLRFTT
jgi:hypothetical protein